MQFCIVSCLESCGTTGKTWNIKNKHNTERNKQFPSPGIGINLYSILNNNNKIIIIFLFGFFEDGFRR